MSLKSVSDNTVDEVIVLYQLTGKEATVRVENECAEYSLTGRIYGLMLL